MAKSNLPQKASDNKSIAVASDNEMEDNLPMEVQVTIPKIPQYKIEYCAGSNVPKSFRKGLITTGEDTQVESVDFVLLNATQQRSLWGDYDPSDEDQQPICRSGDGIRPNNGSEPKEGPCVQINEDGKPVRDKFGKPIPCCDMAKWSKDKSGEDVPPECSEVLRMFCWDLNNNVPFTWNAHRTQLKHALKFLKEVASPASRDKYKYEGVRTSMCIKANVKVNQVKNYYEPDFSITERLSEEDARKYNGMFEMAKNFLENKPAEEASTKEVEEIPF